MSQARPLAWRAMVPLAALAAALLACSLSWGEPGAQPPVEPGDAGTQPPGARAPTVTILEPASGARVPAGQRVDITVETDTSVDSFLLSVSGRVAGTKALPPNQSGPAKAILSWTPEREGTFSVEVVAFRGNLASAPAALILEVAGVAAGPTTGSAAGCTGRVLVSQLNYRAGPGTGTSRLGQFEVGERVTVIGRNADTSWYQVQRANSQQVWVINNAQWLQVEGQCAALPVTG